MHQLQLLTPQACLLTLFAKIKLSRKFLNLQYIHVMFQIVLYLLSLKIFGQAHVILVLIAYAQMTLISVFAEVSSGASLF